MLLPAAAIALALPAGASADWPSYGHDLANSRDAGSTAPSPREARTLHRRWTFRIGTGGITGTPVVVGRTALVVSSRCVVYALDSATGRLRWKRRLVSLGCAYMPGSAAVDGGVVYVAMGSKRLRGPQVVAMTLDQGAIRWHAYLDPSQGFADVYGSPTVWNGGVYIGISAIGEEEGFNHARVRGAVVALDAGTGALRWRTYTVPPGFDGGAVWSSLAVDPAAGALYAGNGNSYHRPAAPITDSILALEPAGGAITGFFSAFPGDVFLDRHPNNGPDADFGASPNLFNAAGGRPLVGELAKDGRYWALDRTSMAPVWSRRTGTVNVGGALASTAYDGVRIYGQNDQGQVWALDPATGGQLWCTPRRGLANFSPLAVGNGVLYSIESKGFLDARRTTDGAVLSRLPLGQTAWGGVSIDGRTVLAVTGTDESRHGYVVAFRPR